MSKRKCKFTEKLATKYKLFVKGRNEEEAKCVPCDSFVSVGSKGAADLEKHISTEKHKKSLQASSSCMKLDNFFVQKNSSVDFKLKAAEGTLAYHTVSHHQSYRSLDCTSSLLKKIIPDSEITAKFGCGRTKTEAIVNHVLSPHAQETLISSLNSVNFYGIGTDASNHGATKMFPVVVQYFQWFNGIQTQVNNTNIHVEHVRRSQKKNPNIFSDSGDDFDCISDVPIDKIVINAERLRKKEISRNRTKKKSNLTQEVPHHHHPNHQTPQMRTISQQCTLDYSSENPLSDSILDKSDLTSPLSPTKILPVSIKLTKDNIIEEGCGVAMETSMAADTTVHLSTRRENSPVDEAHHYAEIEELRSSESTIRGGRFGLGGKDSSLARLRSPSNMSRVSSASATDLDELYQQIRRGPANCRSRKGQHFGAGDDARPQRAYSSPFLSDSEATGFSDMTRNREEILTGSADVETTV